MIRTFGDKETRKIYNRERSSKLPNNIQQIALRKLRMLNNAKSLNDLRIPPANRLEKLKSNRQGRWSVRINEQWRICFAWQNGDAFEVEITDYH